MKTNVLIVLDTRVKKADGTFPLILRIVHNRKSSQIPLGISLHPKDWDEEQHLIKSSFKGTESVARLNNQILKKKVEAMDVISKLDEKKVIHAMTVTQIKELIDRKPAITNSVFTYTQKLIDEMIASGRIGNARSYKSTLTALKTFRKEKDFSFIELNYAFLQKLEADHLAKGNSLNGLAVRMRTIKAIYNRAIKDGIVDKELYPFVNYQIKTKKTRKRAISVSAISKVEGLVFESGHPLYHAHNYFLFCFYMMGLPFADMAHLKISNLIGGRLVYNRQKTDKGYNIKVPAKAQKILDKYISGKTKDEFIFPIIYRKTPQEQYKDVEWARARYNKKLKKIALLCDIEESLTSYIGRHSFASIARNLGIPIANISDMLGHSSIKTTEIYLDSLPTEIMDMEHEKILKSTKTNISKKDK